MWRRNPIDWPLLYWIKSTLLSVVSQQSQTLSSTETSLLRQVLLEIADDHPNERDYAHALLAQLPTSGILLTSQLYGFSLENQLRHFQQTQHQLWWEIYYFLSKFEERPTGQIILAPLPRQPQLAELTRQVNDGNVFAIPDYIWEHIRQTGATGKLPPLHFPNIAYFCATHQRYFHKFSAYDSDQCPRTRYQDITQPHRDQPTYAPCQIVPELYGLDDWLSWMQVKNNLFALKKREFPQPTSVKILLDRFFDLHRKDPAYLLFPKEVRAYFQQDLSDPMEVIANLNIPPPIPSYPVLPITWDELVKLTNLRQDLILHIPTTHWYQYGRNYLGGLSENVSPRTILRFGTLYLNRHQRWEPSNPTCGIILHSDNYYWNRRKKATVEYAVFG